MSKKYKPAEVTVSFHYLVRQIKTDGEILEEAPITKSEFDGVFKHLENVKEQTLHDSSFNEKVRYRLSAIIKSVEKYDGRFISGMYETSYWGHSFNNSVKGKIPADSLNLRQFFFLLYLSNSGHLYIASQYLGTYGGYTAIKNTLLESFTNPNEISAHSFNIAGNLDEVSPRQIEIKFSRQESSITKLSSFGNIGALVIKKQSRTDDEFENTIRQRLFKHSNKKPAELRKQVAELLKSQDLLEIKDEEIEDCTVIAMLRGKRKVIHLLDEGSFASRIPVNVALDSDGLPEYGPLKTEVSKILKSTIIARRATND